MNLVPPLNTIRISRMLIWASGLAFVCVTLVWIINLRTEQRCSLSTTRGFALEFAWDGRLKSLDIKDMQDDKNTISMRLRKTIEREAAKKVGTLASETRLGKFGGRISLHFIGCTDPYPISWSDPQIPLLTRFMSAAELRDVPALKDILETGINPNARDFQQHTALMYAVVDPFKQLNRHPDIIEKSNFRPDILAVKLLLSAGSDPNYQDTYGVAPLHLADTYAAKFLIDSGAEINVRDHQGKTPLMYAAGKSDQGLVSLLLKSKASVSLRDYGDNSALIYAVSAGSLE
ncbi:MAG: ankyrin repeat domain-containing protein, partial [Terriglobales bacterium]